MWLNFNEVKYDKLNKERRCSMNATPTRPTNKNQWQGAQEGPKQKQDRAQGRARSCLSLNDIHDYEAEIFKG
jgi:hypothetical protein